MRRRQALSRRNTLRYSALPGSLAAKLALHPRVEARDADDHALVRAAADRLAFVAHISSTLGLAAPMAPVAAPVAPRSGRDGQGLTRLAEARELPLEGRMQGSLDLGPLFQPRLQHGRRLDGREPVRTRLP